MLHYTERCSIMNLESEGGGKMANLFEIAERFKALSECVELVASGELEAEVLEESLNTLEGELSDKLQNITYIIRKQEADLILIDEEVKRLQARKKTLNSSIDRLKQYMYNAMKLTGAKKVSTALNTWSIAKNPLSVNIIDESGIDDNYLIKEVVTKVDKKKILADLKEGKEVQGAELKQSERIAIK